MELFGLNVLKSAIILAVILLYWKFVYYKYHKKAITPISFFVIGGSLAIIGFYLFAQGKVSFEEIKYAYYIFIAFAAFSFTSLILAIHKHGIKKDVDITLTWTKKTFPFIPFYFWIIISFPVFFFIMVTTSYWLGQEYVIFWCLITLAWVRSNVRLYRLEIVK